MFSFLAADGILGSTKYLYETFESMQKETKSIALIFCRMFPQQTGTRTQFAILIQIAYISKCLHLCF